MAVVKTCESLKKKILKKAAEYLNCSEDELEFAGKTVRRLNAPEGEPAEITLKDIGNRAMCFNEEALQATESHSSPVSPPPFMAGAAEVEIDKETGHIELLQFAAAEMCIRDSGFIMLTRLSLDKGLDKAFKQFVIVAAAAILSWLVPFIMERFWQLYKFQWVYAGIGLAALLVVWVAGNESFGAQLSLTVGGISIKPSEFVKISFVFFVASMFYQSLDFKNICITTVVAALHVVILVLSKDLGSALIFFISYVIMLFISTGNWLYLIAAGVLGKGATSIAYTLFDHVRRRFTAWKNPWADIDNTGSVSYTHLFGS